MVKSKGSSIRRTARILQLGAGLGSRLSELSFAAAISYGRARERKKGSTGAQAGKAYA